MKSSIPYQAIVQELLKNNDPRIAAIIQKIDQVGARALLVGGAVRDIFLNREVKDLDIEVHGLPLEKLQEILSLFGHVEVVGKSFGVLRVFGLDVDWSLPRTDATGRKPHVTIDPFMAIQDAFSRRDLTINAMGIDLTTYELIDPFNGLQDLQKGVLRAPSAQRFIEDPLRFYRVMQFISRFSFYPDEPLTQLCKTMDLTGVSRERLEQEMNKLLLKSQRPSLGLRWLKSIGRLQEVFPELAATVHTPQEPDWHPEGTVFEHLMQTVDAAALIEYPDLKEKLIIMYAALCHDLGKAVSTKIIDGRLRSHGHDVAGVPLAKTFLLRITHDTHLIDAVSKLVRYHMAPGLFIKEGAKPPAYKRLARNVAPQVTIGMLALLSQADKQGRNGASSLPLTSYDADVSAFLLRAIEIGVDKHPEPPILLGRDLLDVVAPGPELGQLVAQAYEIQIEKGITDKEELKRRVLEN